MEITDVTCVKLEGTLEEYPEGILQERLARPTDVYDEYRAVGSRHVTTEPGGPHPLTQYFLTIETSDGLRGLGGPLDRLWATATLEMGQDLLGQNALATEKIADVLFGRWGDAITGVRAKAISAIDVALWDLRGKHYDAPVYELLGGPTRDTLPCYASMLGFSVDPDDVRQRASEYHERGFQAQKWFFRHGPGSGEEGIERNLALAKAATEATPEHYDIMFDCWRSWGTSYTRTMVNRLAPYEPRWLEQPIDSQHIDQFARLTADAPFPIAGGEHDTTRWDFHQLLSAHALDIIQPDTYYTGGVSEATKICTLASTHDVPVMLHGHSVPANVHVIAAQPPTVCPLVEFLIQRNARYQHFFDESIVPNDGVIELPQRPGIGVEIDENTVERKESYGLE